MKEVVTSHYSLGQDSARLSKWAHSTAFRIRETIPLNAVPVLVYCGMSGISLATGLSLALHQLGREHGMLYVRKRKEESHGGPVERFNAHSEWTRKRAGVVVQPQWGIFVDDLVSTGNTLRWCLDKLREEGYSLHWNHDLSAVFQSGYSQDLNEEFARKIIRKHTGATA